MFNNFLIKRLAPLSLIFLASFMMVSSRGVSASTVTAAGITVSPAIINLDLQKDQLTNSFKVSLTNNTNNPVTLTISSVDFKSLNDTGGIAFIGSNVAEAARRHALTAWITTPSAPVTIAAKQTIKVPIVIENRTDLGPGGHYAALLYTISDVGSSTGATRVNVNEVASTLVFVRKLDGALFGINLNKFRVAFSWWHIPTNINLYFQNIGNIQIVPRGLMTVVGPNSKEVSRGQINTDSALVLPDNTRLYRTTVFRTSSAWLPGTYKVHVSYHIDGSDKMQSADSSFTFVNLPLIFEVIFGIFLLRFFGKKLIHRKTKKTPRKSA